MKWTRTGETEMLSTPVYLGLGPDVAAMAVCPHDTYEPIDGPDEVPEHPEAKKNLEKCVACQAVRARLIGPSELLDRLFAKTEGNLSNDDSGGY